MSHVFLFFVCTFFIVIFYLLCNIVMEIMCWDARNLTFIVNIFWAILCFFFVLCPHFERMLYYDILGSRVMERILWGWCYCMWYFILTMVHEPRVTREPREIINHSSHLLCVYLTSTKSMSTPMSSLFFFAFQAFPTWAIAPQLV